MTRSGARSCVISGPLSQGGRSCSASYETGVSSTGKTPPNDVSQTHRESKEHSKRGSHTQTLLALFIPRRENEATLPSRPHPLNNLVNISRSVIPETALTHVVHT